MGGTPSPFIAFGQIATNLAPIVVEASRLNETAAEMPIAVQVVTRAEIDRSGARDMVDLLEKCGNVFFRKPNANPTGAQISMRGYGANGFGRVKILVDGEVLNNADMSAQDLMRVPLQSISSVEILRGPQTVLHGGDASAGVINIRTDQDSYEHKTILEVQGGSWETYALHAGVRGGYEIDLVTYYADFDWKHSHGYRANTQSDIYSAKGGVKKRWENGSYASIRTFYADSQYGLPGGISDYGGADWKARAREADDHDSHARDSVYGVTLEGSFVIAENRRLEASYAARHRDNAGYVDYDMYNHKGSIKYVDENRLGKFENTFVLGTDLGYDDISVYAAVDNEYRRFTGALFARDEFYLLEELSLVAGIRGEGFQSRDRYHASLDCGTENRKDGRVAGDVGFNYRPVEDLKLFARWSRFYHAPLADEMFSAYGVPNMALVPEVGHTTEVGADWTLEKEYHFDLTLFHTEQRDEIMYLNYHNDNLDDDTQRDGIETSLGWEREKVGSARVAYTFTEARFAAGAYKDHIIPLVPRQQVRLMGEWYVWDECAVQGGYRFVGRQRYGSDFAGEGGMLSDYGIFDAGIRYMPERWGLKGLTLAFTVDNLFDKCYADYAEWISASESHYFYPAMGRCFLFRVRYEF